MELVEVTMASMGTMGHYCIYVVLLWNPIEGPGFADEALFPMSSCYQIEYSTHDLPALDLVCRPMLRTAVRGLLYLLIYIYIYIVWNKK